MIGLRRCGPSIAGWLTLALVGPACGSGALQGPGDDRATPTSTIGGSVTTTSTPTSTGVEPPGSTTTRIPTTMARRTTTTRSSEEEEWSWGLPTGDVSPAELERAVYRELQSGCRAGQVELDRNWAQLLSPLTVLLFQSAVYVCSGDRDRGREAFVTAGRQGWSGVSRYETVCNTYKAVRSVLEQTDPADIACPGGDLPRWPSSDPSVPRDDPRTPEDESASTTTSSGGTSTTTRTTTSGG